MGLFLVCLYMVCHTFNYEAWVICMVQTSGKFHKLTSCRDGICGTLTGREWLASSRPQYNAQKNQVTEMTAALKLFLSLLSSWIWVWIRKTSHPRVNQFAQVIVIAKSPITRAKVKLSHLLKCKLQSIYSVLSSIAPSLFCKLYFV